MADSPAFIIRELEVPDPIEVRLVDLDLPFGFRRDTPMWTTGGSVEIADGEGTYLPGGAAPIFHVLYSKEHPRTIKGAFRAGYAAEMRVADPFTHPREMKRKLDRIRLRGSAVEITWAGETCQGIIKDTKFGEEDFDPTKGAVEITYEVTFLISSPAETQSQSALDVDPARDGVNDSLGDITTLMNQRIAARQEEMTRVALLATVQANLSVQWTALADAMERVNDAVVQMESQAVGKGFAILTAAQRTSAAALAATKTVDELADFIDQSYEDLMASADDTFVVRGRSEQPAHNRYQWELTSTETLDEMETWRSYFRNIRAAAASRVRDVALVYTVLEGDTLESIAASVLRDSSRGSDLGVTQADLIPGRQILLPNT